MASIRLPYRNFLFYRFAALWAVVSAILAWLLAARPTGFESINVWVAVAGLIPCTVMLMRLLPNPIQQESPNRQTMSGMLAGWIIVVVLGWIIAALALGKFFILLFPVIAAVILLLLKQPLDRQQWRYAAFLALIASSAGIANASITFITPLQWGLFQFPLTLFGFLSGWGILRRTGLLAQGVGQSRFLSEGAWPAARSFLLGMLLSLPWALGNVVMGGAEGSRTAWVQAWWQPLVALNPGIAEEAWGRLLFVPLAFLLFRRVSSNRTAFSTALIVMAFLFAFLHTTGSGSAVNMLVSTLILVVFVLPLSVICFYRDLETAIGFHFWMDCFKFVIALILVNG